MWRRVKPLVKPSLPFLSKGFQDASLLLLCFFSVGFSSGNYVLYDNVFWKLSIPYLCYYTLSFFGNFVCGIVSSLHGRNRTYIFSIVAVLFGNLFLLGVLPFTLKLLPLHAVAFSFIGIGSGCASCCIMPTIMENSEEGPKHERISTFVLLTRVSEFVGFFLVILFGSLLYLLLGEKYRNWIIFLLQCQAFTLHVLVILSVSEAKESNLFTSSMTSRKLNFFTLIKYLWSSYLQNGRYITLLCAALMFLASNSVSLWFVVLAEYWPRMANSGRWVFYIVWILFASSRVLISCYITKLIEKFGYYRVFLYSCSLIAAVECLYLFLPFSILSSLLALTYTFLVPVVVTFAELFLMYLVPSRTRSSWIGIAKSMESIGAFSVMIPILVLLRPNMNIPVHLDRVKNMRVVYLWLWFVFVVFGYWLMGSISLLPDSSLRQVDEQYQTGEPVHKKD